MIRSVNITTSISRNAGGLFSSVRRLVQELALMPMDISVLGTSDEFTAQDIKEWDPVLVYPVKARGYQQFGYSSRYKHFLEFYHPDILHTHGLWNYSSIATHSYATSAKTPYMISPHGMVDPWAIRNSYWKKVLAYHLYERAHLHDASCMRALCESEAESFRKYGLKNPIAIIPNGIDLPEMPESRDEGRGSRGKGENGIKKLLFLGRVHPKKGLVNALKAFAESRGSRVEGRRHEKWQFVIAGWDQGGHEAELMKLCEELGLSFSHKMQMSHKEEGKEQSVESRESSVERQWSETDVLFHGPAFGEEKDALLRGANAFILSSFSEGLPMSVLEAWAYGLPVLMTPECNLPEGFAADAALKIETDVESIAQGVDTFFSMSDADLNTMGARGRRLVEERFTWKTVAAQMAGVYEWMMGGGETPACVQ